MAYFSLFTSAPSPQKNRIFFLRGEGCCTQVKLFCVLLSDAKPRVIHKKTNPFIVKLSMFHTTGDAKRRNC